MREKLRFLGLDVHAETIAVAVAEPDGEVRSLGTIANREDSVRKFIKKLGSPEQLRACYEAGPTGFVLYWQMTQLGVECAVEAPKHCAIWSDSGRRPNRISCAYGTG
jgi:transposase